MLPAAVRVRKAHMGGMVDTGRNYGFFNVEDVTLLAVEISF